MEAKTRKLLIGGGAATAATAAAVGAAPTAQAADFAVTNLNDSGAGSLRQAVLDANALPGADTISFDAAVTGTIVLTTGQLAITDGLTITGPGRDVLAISGNDASRVFYLYNSAGTIDVAISGLTVQDGASNIGAGLVSFDENIRLDDMRFIDNNATGDGGALWMDGFNMVFEVTNSEFSGNSSGTDGGAVYVEDTGGTSFFQQVVISGNTAADDGGGIYFYDPDTAVSIVESTISGNSTGDRGGGVYLYDTDGGPFTIDRSTISGNTAGTGAGLFLYGPDNPFLIIGSTISGNTATGAGGGMFLYSSYSGFEIRHTTIFGNSAPTGSGLSIVNNGVVLDHSIVAGNTPGGDITNTDPIDANFSLIEDPSGTVLSGASANNLTGVGADLAALGNNGGPTQTHMPNAASPVIDGGDPAIVGAPATDQRGAIRIQPTAIDIGAVESVAAPTNDVGSTPEDTPLSVAAPGVLGNDEIVGLTPAVTVAPAHGTVTLNADGSYLYTPSANYNGVDSFTYGFSGLGAPAGTATVTITVTPVNDPPVAVNDVGTANPGGPLTIPVRANDSDVDGDVLTITAVTQGARGTVTISGGNVVYTPSATASGTDTFTYTISDGTLTATATVTITITTAPTTTQPAILPETGNGAGASTTAVVATGTLVIGATLTLTARRRRHRSA